MRKESLPPGALFGAQNAARFASAEATHRPTPSQLESVTALTLDWIAD
jgi:hypothetical protein